MYMCPNVHTYYIYFSTVLYIKMRALCALHKMATEIVGWF